MPISPDQGSTGGGTIVTVTGTNLTGASAVTFGTKPGTNLTPDPTTPPPSSRSPRLRAAGPST